MCEIQEQFNSLVSSYLVCLVRERRADEKWLGASSDDEVAFNNMEQAMRETESAWARLRDHIGEHSNLPEEDIADYMDEMDWFVGQVTSAIDMLEVMNLAELQRYDGLHLALVKWLAYFLYASKKKWESSWRITRR